MHILIADDHAIVRRGLREILTDAFSGAEFSDAANGDEVLAQLAGSPYGLLLLDINMPGRSGLEVLQTVKEKYPQLPVIMVSVQPESQYASRCLRAGAAAYVGVVLLAAAELRAFTAGGMMRRYAADPGDWS